MPEINEELLYSETHEWVKLVDDDTALIGITDYAQDQLGDVVFVELPQIGSKLKATEPFGSVESVKAVSDLFMPVDGEVLEINESLSTNPEIINKDPYNEGWMIKIKITDKSQISNLLKPEDYKNTVSQ